MKNPDGEFFDIPRCALYIIEEGLSDVTKKESKEETNQKGSSEWNGKGINVPPRGTTRSSKTNGVFLQEERKGRKAPCTSTPPQKKSKASLNLLQESPSN